MHIPEKRVCDLCRGELTGAYVKMSYPLSEADSTALTQKIDMPGPFGAILGGMIQSVPQSWRFDFCRGCADGFMPMLEELKTHAVKTWLEERQRRAETPIGESGS